MSSRRGVGLLLAWSMLGVGVAVAAFVVMVRTGYGQRLDFSAFEGRKWTSLWARRQAVVAVRVLTPITVVVVTIGSVVVAYVRRGLLPAVAAALAMPATLVIARAAKTGLPRSELLVGSWISADNTFPSGHTAAACTAALCAVAVSPPEWRARVTAFAFGGLGLQVLGMGVSGWHRPSDLLGGLGLAVAVAGVASAAVVGQCRVPSRADGPEWFERTAPSALALGSLTGAALMWYLVTRALGSTSYGRFEVHLMVAMGSVIAAGAAVLVHARLVSRADVGRG